MSPILVTVITVALIILSAFFVIIEFALLGARPHRLEEKAQTSRSARAALRGVNELTIMLAGAQLGITVCTFALGAVTKPAVDYALSDLFGGWGMPAWTADVLAFGIALLFVTFLHLVIGEMAPKSWAIAHPELAATTIGLPARAFIAAFRPLLVWMNDLASLLVKRSGFEPVDRAAVGGHDATSIRQLVEHSAQLGVLETSFHSQIEAALELQTMQVGELVRPDKPITCVAAGATVRDVQQIAGQTGHLRIFVGDDSEALSLVHVRDTMVLEQAAAIAPLARAAFMIDAHLPVHEALTTMRAHREQLAVVTSGDRRLGVISISDILRRILPEESAAV
ncbi:CNNM domain-containing protein [Pseudactinotalea sp.]|uniref:CNNM domain-containing protein n=1 Tax=Pseudactinotalea sp. TaxID=1926260 RepID=UPI003B3A6853